MDKLLAMVADGPCDLAVPLGLSGAKANLGGHPVKIAIGITPSALASVFVQRCDLEKQLAELEPGSEIDRHKLARAALQRRSSRCRHP